MLIVVIITKKEKDRDIFMISFPQKKKEKLRVGVAI